MTRTIVAYVMLAAMLFVVNVRVETTQRSVQTYIANSCVQRHHRDAAMRVRDNAEYASLSHLETTSRRYVAESRKQLRAYTRSVAEHDPVCPSAPGR